MGVINLGLLVEKIKGKLESSGFIKNTDYASASAAGVVKVGTGLAITDAGVLSVSGGSGSEFEQLYTEASTPVATTSAITLSASSAGYKALLIAFKRETSIISCWCTTVQNISNVTCGPKQAGSSPSALAFTPNGTDLTMSFGANAELTWYAVYGIK